MTVADNARAERMAFAGYTCEAHGLHHKTCPGDITTANAHQYVLHHLCRKQDKHFPDYDNRDDVQYLRIVFNGTTSLGAAGCHGEIHRNQNKARTLGLLAERELAAVIPFPNFNRPIELVEHNGHLIPVSTLAHQPDGGAA